jgi:ribosome modulation factor
MEFRGWSAHLAGRAVHECPYPGRTAQRKLWRVGWMARETQLAEQGARIALRGPRRQA